jgi:hypothetical protein
MNTQTSNSNTQNTDAPRADFVAWNTGRQYTEQGQRLAARIVGDVVLFADVDRCIYGAFGAEHAAKIIEAAKGGPWGFKSAVLSAYDACAYVWEGFEHDEAMSETKTAAITQHVPAPADAPADAPRVYPSPILVWIDADGHHCAAQLTAARRVAYYVRRAHNPDSYGAVELDFYLSSALAVQWGDMFNPDVFDDILKSYRAKVENLGALSWIEGRELNEAASDQNPEPERFLSDAIRYPERVEIDDKTRAEIVALLANVAGAVQ